jgi:peptidoglycan/xylan/chitin deacetylase (PgdA/CDA1 family)
VRKIKKILLLSLIACTLFSNIILYAEAKNKEFKDVTDGHWFKDDVELLVENKIIDGYNEEYFKPDDILLVSHYIKMVVAALGEKVESAEGYWAWPYVDKAVSLGLITPSEYPYKDTLEKPASRAEVAMLTARAVEIREGFEPNYAIYRHFITDFDEIPEKYASYVCQVYSKGIIQGYLDGRFMHNKAITRAEACAIIARMLYPEKRPKAAQFSKNAKEVPVLLYHHLLKEEENNFEPNGSIVSVESFQEQMDFLYKNGYNTITLKQLGDYMLGKTNLPEKSVLITFDDGYKSNYIYAYPIMKKYSFRGVIFLITGRDYSKAESFNPKKFQYLSQDEIDSSRDVFEYASHTHSMHEADEVKGAHLTWKTEEEIVNDLTQSKNFLNTEYLAYPFGRYTSDTLRILEQLGFKMAFTIKSGSVKPGDNMLELNRNIIYPNTTIKQFKKIVKGK